MGQKQRLVEDREPKPPQGLIGSIPVFVDYREWWEVELPQVDEPEELDMVNVRKIRSIYIYLWGEKQGRMIEIVLNKVHGGTQVKVVSEVSPVWID